MQRCTALASAASLVPSQTSARDISLAGSEHDTQPLKRSPAGGGRASLVVSALLLLALALTTPTCSAGWLDGFLDSDDGQFDLSEWLLNRKGFMPVPIIITEPAVGYGGGVMALFFRESLSEAATRGQETGRLAPPDI